MGSEGAGGALLENIANNVSPGERRRGRYKARETLWKVTGMQRVRYCGRFSTGHGVELRAADAIAGYAGLQHCGSVWACPVCASRILVHRALEVGAVLGEAIRQGHPLGFVTLTMRHTSAQALELLWNAARKGWQRSISGKGWKLVEDSVEGWVRVWEVTYGRNGWHVHVHCVVVLAQGVGEAEFERVASGMFRRWSRGLEAAGLEAPTLKGQEWHLVEGEKAAAQLSDYLAKSAAVELSTGDQLGFELTHTSPGRSRQGLKTRPVWSLLGELVETGEAQAFHRWREWEAGSKGKQQIGWSNGLRDRFAPALEEQTDQAIVDEAVGSEDDGLAFFTEDQWRQVIEQPGLALTLIEWAEQGPAALRALVLSWPVECTLLAAARVERWEPATGGRRGGEADARHRRRRPPPPEPDRSRSVTPTGYN